MAPADLPARLAAIVGTDFVLTDPEAVAPFSLDWRKRYSGRAGAVVRPASTLEVSQIVRLCAETQTAVVPQGGNTGLAGGATPDTSGTQIVISLSRLQRIRRIDTGNNSLLAEAGCTLATVQAAANAAQRLFPLSLAAEGSCQIGGVLSTNAGGTAVLRYGNARELTLGLEVVLSNGEIWDGLRALRKDNTGYDLKQLFLGAEGTLGVITAAVLKLFPLPLGEATALVGVDSSQQAITLLEHARSQFGDRLTAFELFSQLCLDLVLRHFPECHTALARSHPHYVLLELRDSTASASLREMLGKGLGLALDQHLLLDAVIASNSAQAARLWALRENISEAQAREGMNLKHDVSLPASAIADFLATTDAALAKQYPGVRIVCFGHLGDGNLHYNITAPIGADPQAFLKQQAAINRVVHDQVSRFAGSISAEHGIGQLRRTEILRYKSAVEMDLMHRIKAALDPLGIMNPGKVL